ncbi:MAG: hypothetical protein NC200_05230, partial [Candidatus Gastranaerophilales bacterium]|nr:hypothetical protein [Candidatus Gastranaerophilales bacterium]
FSHLDASKDLLITYKVDENNEKEIVVLDYFSNKSGTGTKSSVKQLEFSDGSLSILDEGIISTENVITKISKNNLNGTVFSDIIDASSGKKSVKINAYSGNDDITGSVANDKIYLGNGHKTINIGASDGNDTIYINIKATPLIDLKLTDSENNAIDINKITFGRSTNGKDLYIYRNGKKNYTVVKDYFKLNPEVRINESSVNDMITSISIEGALTKSNKITDSEYSDVIVLGNKNDKVTLSQGDDVVNLKKGNDTVVLTSDYSGTKTIKTREGSNTLDLTKVNIDGDLSIVQDDTNIIVNNNIILEDIIATNTAFKVKTNKGSYTIKTGEGKINGTSGNDYIYGSAADDIISSGKGNDIIYTNGGNDTINLSAGNNTIIFSSDEDASAVINLSKGYSTPNRFIFEDKDYADFYTKDDGSGNYTAGDPLILKKDKDLIIGDNVTVKNIDGKKSTIILDTKTGTKTINIGTGKINGTFESEIIIGSDSKCTINSNGGNDLIYAGKGNDIVNITTSDGGEASGNNTAGMIGIGGSTPMTNNQYDAISVYNEGGDDVYNTTLQSGLYIEDFGGNDIVNINDETVSNLGFFFDVVNPNCADNHSSLYEDLFIFDLGKKSELMTNMVSAVMGGNNSGALEALQGSFGYVWIDDQFGGNQTIEKVNLNGKTLDLSDYTMSDSDLYAVGQNVAAFLSSKGTKYTTAWDVIESYDGSISSMLDMYGLFSAFTTTPATTPSQDVQAAV